MTALLILLAITCFAFGFYFGYTFAKEVRIGCYKAKSERRKMTFKERQTLENEYYEWLKHESLKNDVCLKDCPLTVIGYMDSRGLI